MNKEDMMRFIKFFDILYEVLVKFESENISKPSKYDSYFSVDLHLKWTYSDFVGRLKKDISKIGPEKNTIICSFIYLDRLLNANKKLLKRQNLYNLVMISIILSHKYTEDVVFVDKCYCKLLKKDMKLFCSLEIIVCELIHYRLYISENTFSKYLLKVSC